MNVTPLRGNGDKPPRQPLGKLAISNPCAGLLLRLRSEEVHKQVPLRGSPRAALGASDHNI